MTPRKPRTSTHSVRTVDSLWAQASARAKRDNVTMNHVLNEFLEGYALGVLDLPKVVKDYGSAK